MQPDTLLTLRKSLDLQLLQVCQVSLQVQGKHSWHVFVQFLKTLNFRFPVLAEIPHDFFSVLPAVQFHKSLVEDLLRLEYYVI